MKTGKKTGKAAAFSAEERAAMKEYVQEKRGGPCKNADGESGLMEKIAAMA